MANVGQVCVNCPEIRYTRSLDKSGWLRIKLEPSGLAGYVCEYVKVVITERKGGRIYFTIQENLHAGEQASLSSQYETPCLSERTRDSGVLLTVTTDVARTPTFSPIRKETLNQLFATLDYHGIKITLDSDVNYEETNRASPDYKKIKHSVPLPKGKYKILTPIEPKIKDLTARYTAVLSSLHYDTVWFPIENPATFNSNFIHVGHLSEGCLTCYEIDKWNDLYSFLIRHRLDGKGKYIGEVVIK